MLRARLRRAFMVGAVVTAAVLGMLAMGCSSGSNRLEGSLDQGYPFPFSEVRARLYSSELATHSPDAAAPTPLKYTTTGRFIRS